MIQLANDPQASRAGWRPAPSGAQAAGTQRPVRSGHAWPFLSRPSEQGPTAARSNDRPAATESGS
ncbi:hypothetical protein [Ramlibacter sp.]|uniref:hypothetical protein n=1 Tax=Ramlibacter sp. TaxID=1917967 RepID=UPI00257D3661|nr:hypothetical protein [Ramlibacter sp.]